MIQSLPHLQSGSSYVMALLLISKIISYSPLQLAHMYTIFRIPVAAVWLALIT